MTRPLRVVIAGSSVSLLVVPRTGRADGTYGELLPDLLAARGIDVEVLHSGRWFDLISDLRRRYESSVRNHFPDVLVLHYGIVDCQPNVLPTWLARHFQSWDRSSRPAALAYREHLANPLWGKLRGVQRATATWPTHRLSPTRYATELRRVITMARAETGCLVLLLDLDPPGPRFEHWMPGITRRAQQFQVVQDDLIRELGDDLVRNVRIAHHVAERSTEEVLPDGIHRSPLGHQLAAEALAKEVAAWVAL